MKKSILLLLSVGFVSTSFAEDFVIKQQKEHNDCHEVHQQAMKNHMNAFFNVVDTNKDGQISRIELLSESARHFDKIDLNEDGFLSVNEIAQSIKAKMKENKGSHKVKHHVKRVLKDDVNKDGVISKVEYLADLSERFDERDLNKDGYITQEEVHEFYHAKVKEMHDKIEEYRKLQIETQK